MVQTLKSLLLSSGQRTIFLEKPHILRRIFFKITALLPLTANYQTNISFDDPLFVNYYVLVGPNIYFRAEGDGIFQGNIFVRNMSSIPIFYTATEILV